MPPRSPAEYRLVEAESRERLNRLLDRGAAAQLKKLYEEAQEDLVRKLAKAAGRGDTMTALQLKSMLAQVRQGQALIAKKMTAALGDASLVAQTASLKALIADIGRLEASFTGAQVALPIEQAARFRGVIDASRTSLLSAHATSMANYGAHLVGEMEKSLGQSLLSGETPRDAAEKLADVAGTEQWRAERIVRTELAWASNATALDGMRASATAMPDLYARWSEHVDDVTYAPMDDRVGVDSIAMHGQVARPGGEFTMPPSAPAPDKDGNTEVSPSLVGKSWAHPPNRPNDRAVIAPFRPHWGVPGWTWVGGQRVPVLEVAAPPPVRTQEAPEKEEEGRLGHDVTGRFYTSAPLAGAFKGKDIEQRNVLIHCVAAEDVELGRLRRGAQEALCDKSLNMADPFSATGAAVTCPRCIPIMRQHGIRLPTGTPPAPKDKSAEEPKVAAPIPVTAPTSPVLVGQAAPTRDASRTMSKLSSGTSQRLSANLGLVMTRAGQAEARVALEEVVEAEAGLKTHYKKSDDSTRLAVRPASMMAGADASVDFTGAMEIREDVAKRLGQLAERAATPAGRAKLAAEYAAGGKDAVMQVDALRIALHETVHTTSPIRSAAYKGKAIFVEEVSTELLAREVTARHLGLDAETVLKNRAGVGAYNQWVTSAIEAVARAEAGVPNPTPEDLARARQLLLDGARRMRAPRDKIATASDYVSHWADSVFPGNKTKAAQLVRDIPG